MPKSHTNRGALLTSNLPQLQNLIKRDPKAYREEFLQQWIHYQSILRIFKLNPNEHAQHFRELTSFISQVIQCYLKEAAEFPNDLASLLSDNYQVLNPDIRRSLVQNLVMLRNKDVISSIDLLKTLFPLLPRTTSASLRSHIRKTILTDIKTANSKAKNHRVNRAVQAMLFAMVERGMDAEVQGDKGKIRANSGTEGVQKPSNAVEALWAVVLTKELWRKGVWNDTKCVSIVALTCFHPVAKVQNAALHFFLGADEEEDTDSESEGEIPDIKTLEHRRTINKKTKSGEKKLAKSKKAAKRKQKEKKEVQPNFPALQLINDPQSFGEKLYDNLVKYDKRYSLDHKALMMQLLSRVMGVHKLCVLGFYTYIIKYLTHHQLQITLVLVSLAQSTHDLTPPDVLTPVIRKIAQEFVHPGVGPEVVAAGINAIREVCRRQPWCMEEDLLGDLIAYRKSRDKGVVTASRGLLQLYREVNPSMLKRRERGKEASMGMQAAADKPLAYGHSKDAAVDIEGLHLLEDHLNAQRAEQGDEDEEMDNEAAWEGWDVESNPSGDSGDSESWHDVQSDAEEAFDVSDSDRELPKTDKGKGKVIGQEGGEEKEDVEMTDETPRVSTLATTKILTPADFALLQELRIKAARKAVDAGGGSSTKRTLAMLEAQKKATAASSAYDEDTSAAFVAQSAILGVQKKKKADYEERMASIQKGREGREKFGSYKGKKRKASQSSSTNREKRRNKPLMMVLASNAVRSKKQASLRDKQKRLRAHIERAKKAYH